MRTTVLLVCLIVVFTLTGCFRYTHTIGSGPHTGEIVHEKQWFAVWGVIPLRDLDAGQLAENKNCRITTEFKPLDCVINFFTGTVSIYRTSITIEK